MTEEIKANLLDYIDPEKFWKDYIRDNHCIVSNLSDTQYNWLRVNKEGIMLRAKAAYHLSALMSEHDCVELACNAVLKLFPENESLDSLFDKWLFEYHSERVLNAKHLGLNKLPAYQDLDDSDKAAFGNWLLVRYSSKQDQKESARMKTRMLLEELCFSKIGDQQIPYSVATELTDRVAVHINFCTDHKDAILLVLRDWFNNAISNPDVNSWIRNWMYNRLAELKNKEK